MKKILFLLFILPFHQVFGQEEKKVSLIYELHANAVISKNQTTPLAYGMYYIDFRNSKIGVWGFSYYEPGVFENLIGPKYVFKATDDLELETGLGIGYDILNTDYAFGGYVWFTNHKYQIYHYMEQSQNTKVFWIQSFVQKKLGENFWIGPGYQSYVGGGLKASLMVNRFEIYTQPSFDFQNKVPTILFGLCYSNYEY